METLQNVLFVAPVLLFSVIAHEYAHGYAALRQGDTTALEMGRLTWNPIKHIDPVLTIMMPLLMGLASGWRVMLGGAKPVPVNPANYKHLKRGDIIVSLAGVATNGIIAVLATILIALFGLIAFNLIPIPPLDGSHVMKYLLPPALSIRYQQLARFGFLILIVLITFGKGALELWMRPAWMAFSLLLGSVDGMVLPRARELFG